MNKKIKFVIDFIIACLVAAVCVAAYVHATSDESNVYRREQCKLEQPEMCIGV